MSPIPYHGLYPEPSGLGTSSFVDGAGSPHPPTERDPDACHPQPDMSWAANLKVALVHDWLNGMRGGEKVFELLCELFPKAPVYTLFHQKDKLSPILQAMDVRESWLGRLPGARKNYRYLLPLMPLAAATLPTAQYDLVLSSSHCVAHGARRGRRAVHVCYCHTPMRYIYDKYDDYFGNRPLSPASLIMRILRGSLQRWDRKVSRQVTSYLCNGVHVAERIQRLYGRDAIPIGAPVDLARFRSARDRAQGATGKGSSEPPYFLTLSALEPYKRVDLCLEAFRRLGPGYRLKVAGSGSQLETLRRQAPNHVEFLGWVPDDQVPDLMARAQALVFPADEDFGIVPLEAAAAGIPTLALASGGSLETVVDGVTGLHFIRQHADDIAGAVLRFAEYRWNPLSMEAHAARYETALVRARLARWIRVAWEQSQMGTPPKSRD